MSDAGFDIEAVKERAAKAAPGPWTFTVDANAAADDDDGSVPDYWTWEIGSDADNESVLCGSELDDPRATVAFVTHARTDVPALVAEVERLRAVVQMLAGRAQLEGQLSVECVRLRAENADLNELRQLCPQMSGVDAVAERLAVVAEAVMVAERVPALVAENERLRKEVLELAELARLYQRIADTAESTA